MVLRCLSMEFRRTIIIRLKVIVDFPALQCQWSSIANSPNVKDWRRVNVRNWISFKVGRLSSYRPLDTFKQNKFLRDINCLLTIIFSYSSCSIFWVNEWKIFNLVMLKQIIFLLVTKTHQTIKGKKLLCFVNQNKV